MNNKLHFHTIKDKLSILSNYAIVRPSVYALDNWEISLLQSRSRTQRTYTSETARAHFRSGLVPHVALIQRDPVLSEVERSISQCPGWNEMGVWRVLQSDTHTSLMRVIERRVLLTMFDSALYGRVSLWMGLNCLVLYKKNRDVMRGSPEEERSL